MPSQNLCPTGLNRGPLPNHDRTRGQTGGIQGERGMNSEGDRRLGLAGRSPIPTQILKMKGANNRGRSAGPCVPRFGWNPARGNTRRNTGYHVSRGGWKAAREKASNRGKKHVSSCPILDSCHVDAWNFSTAVAMGWSVRQGDDGINTVGRLNVISIANSNNSARGGREEKTKVHVQIQVQIM